MLGEKAPTPKKVRVEKDPQGLTVIYHWKNWWMLVPIPFGLAFMAMAIGMIVVTFPGGGFSALAIVLLAFLLLFLGVGVALVYWSLAGVINRTEICVNDNQLSVRHKPLPWRGNITIAVSEIARVKALQEIKTARRAQGREVDVLVTHLVARTEDERELPLVSNMGRMLPSDTGRSEALDAAAFMAQELEVYLNLRRPVDPQETKAEQARQTIEDKHRQAQEAVGAARLASVLVPALVVVGIALLVAGEKIWGLMSMGFAVLFGGLWWYGWREFVKAGGKASSWEELIPWLRLIPRRWRR